MQNIKIAPTFFIIKNVVKIKNVKKRNKRDINKKRKKRILHLCSYLIISLNTKFEENRFEFQV